MTKETQDEVTYDMVYEWVGGDGHKSYILVEMIHELVNGKFDLDKLRDEIITFNREFEDA